MNDDREVLLKVENLCKFFKMGNRELKAVNNVSLDIKKCEVFGLVGESGCGKTTTGRTIIKLYEPTGGNVWFKGRRIVAGTRSYKDEIREKRVWYKEECARLKAEANEKIKAISVGSDEQKRLQAEKIKVGLKEKIDALTAETNAFISEKNKRDKTCRPRG